MENAIAVNNGATLRYFEEKTVGIGLLLEPIVKQLPFMSTNAILAALQKSVECLMEIGIDTKRVHSMKEQLIELRGLRDDYGNLVCYKEYKGFRDMLTRRVCEIVLGAEGLGNLRGFTYVATSSVDGGKMVTGVLNLNPETHSVWNK